MRKTQWSEKRLQGLFERYNRTYWRGRLPRYRVIQAELLDLLGRCDYRKRIIEIDPDQHDSDRQIRATLLHEMAHAATRSGHSVKFFAQMERLLRRGALATIEIGDAGRIRLYGEVVPRRFPLLRKKMRRLEARRAKEVNRYAAEKKLRTVAVTADHIIGDFQEAEIAALPWRHALLVIGLEYGLTDETGRPTSPWARRIVAKGRKAHSSARRDHLDYEKLWRGIQSEEIRDNKS